MDWSKQGRISLWEGARGGGKVGTEQAGMDGLMGRRMDGVMGCGGRGGKSSRAGNAVLCLDLKLMGAHSTLTKGGRACIQCLGVYSG